MSLTIVRWRGLTNEALRLNVLRNAGRSRHRLGVRTGGDPTKMLKDLANAGFLVDVIPLLHMVHTIPVH